ncbi:McrC family protein [Arcobacter sp.]|uniref:McrC family protein n=1 Tax=Arcobacter sp. TaxID=1872629 RepID=UPI003D0D1E30
MSNTIYEYTEVKGALADHIINTPELHKYFTEDWRKVKTSQYCGILNFNNADYYILPKIANRDDEQNLNIFIYMLMYAYDIKLFNENIASRDNLKSNNILEVFIQMFTSGLLNELKKGIYKEYITLQDNLPVLKGKYLINENLKYNFTKNKIYCEYDEFSPNNTLNQFFLYVVKTLQKFVKDKKLLKQCELILDEVEFTQIDINKLNIHFNRLNQRYKTSYEVALLLLQKTIPLFNQGKKSFAFLFDMNSLFEKFIARMIKEQFEDVKIPKKSRKFGELYLKPDIIINSKNLIIDCKYKIIDKDKIASRDDRYQMYVYGNNFENIETTMLLYPKHLDDIDKEIILGDNERQVKLKIKSIDLDFDGNYESYLNNINNKLKEIISG